jgi:TonB family protein
MGASSSAMSRGVVSLGLASPDPEEQVPDDGTPGPISPPGGPRRSGPGGIAISTILHGLIIALVVDIAIVRAPPAPKPAAAAAPSKNAVFLPPPAQVRKLLGLPPRPAPTPPPKEPEARDRISIGAPSEARRRELEFHRDDDITKSAKGTAQGSNAPPAMEVPPTPPPTNMVRDAGASVGEGGRLVQGPVRPGSVPPAGPIHAALQRFETTAVSPGALGVPSGTGGQMGPLDFDPQGADFTAWVQRFINEVYRNWILPPSAVMGLIGEVPIEFVVNRDGSVLEARILQTSGVPAYDRAARNAILASRFFPLPKDYRPDTVTMRATFIYNRREGARGGD